MSVEFYPIPHSIQYGRNLSIAFIDGEPTGIFMEINRFRFRKFEEVPFYTLLVMERESRFYRTVVQANSMSEDYAKRIVKEYARG